MTRGLWYQKDMIEALSSFFLQSDKEIINDQRTRAYYVIRLQNHIQYQEHCIKVRFRNIFFPIKDIYIITFLNDSA